MKGFMCKCGMMKGWLGLILWLLALVALVLAWMIRTGGLYWGLDTTHLMLAAVALGVLAIPCKLMGYCPMCGCSGGDCDNCGGKGCKMCK